MPKLLPDQSFYPSPTMAMQAPAGDARLRGDAESRPGRPDALAVLDVDPSSPAYGAQIGQVDMPGAGDELHHFGWNACSSCLCPYSPHPHMERRYLVVPGMRSSRIHILDTKPDPRRPRIVKVIEADEVLRKTGYSRPHTAHCGPDGIYINALGNGDGDGPGGSSCSIRDLRDQGPLGARARPAVPRLRLLVASRPRHDDHQRVGDAEHGGGRREPGAAPRRQVWPCAARVGSQQPAPRADARPRRGTADGAGAAPGARPDRGLRLRRRGHLPEGSLGLDLALVPRRQARAPWRVRKVIEIPAEPAAPDDLPPLLKGFGAVPPLVTDINLSLDDRFLYVSCWGTGELRQYDVSDPFNPVGPARCRSAASSRRTASRAAGQPLNGGPQMVEISRDGKRVYVTNSLYRAWDEQFYPDGIKGWMAKVDAHAGAAASRSIPRGSCIRRHAAAPGAARRRRRLLRFLLLRVRCVMTSAMTTSWAVLLALGAFHGVNPGMGWLFAVALGMQERRRGRGAAGARAARRRPRAGHCRRRRRGAGDRRRHADRPAPLGSPACSSRSASCDSSGISIRAGRACGWASGADRVVVPDGDGPWRGPDGAARGPGPVDWRWGRASAATCIAGRARRPRSWPRACTPPAIWPRLR